MLLDPSGEWKPSYIDDDNQWEYFDDDGRSSANVYDTSYTQYNDILGPILSDPQYKPPSFTFTDDVDFTKVPLTMNYFLTFLNLTPNNLITIMAFLHLH